MASKLNPGADATLVNVAYRAAMADTPADYSGTLERAADSYAKTMESSKEMWNTITTLGATIGNEMVKNAQELTDMIAKGNTLNPEDAEMFRNEVYGLKDQFKELGTFGGMFGDRETRGKRAELKIKQQELFAEIDLAIGNLKTGADAIAADTIDETMLSPTELDTMNAIVKSNLKNKFTDNGSMAKLSRNESGELMYTLYRKNGELAEDPSRPGEPVTMTLKQFNENIANNVRDGGAKATAFNAYNDQRGTDGSKSKDGVYHEEMKQMDLNYLDTQLQTTNDLKRAIRTSFGYSNTSFFDDITKNQNEYSAELYSGLLKITGGNVLTGDIIDGMQDMDGKEGISAQEAMNTQNYKILTANLLNLKDPKVTKEYFKDYTVKNFEAAFKFGYSNRTVEGGGSGITDDNPYGIPKDGLKLGGMDRYDRQQTFSQDVVTDYINDIKNGAAFNVYDPDTGLNAYTFDNGNWYENKGKENEKKYDSVKQMTDDVFITGGKYFDGLETEIKIDPRTGKTISTDSSTLGSLTEDDTLTISNMFSQSLNENRAQAAINKILKKYKVPQRASVPFTPFNINRVNIGNEEFDTSKPSDQKRMLEIIKQLIGNVPQQNTSAGKTDEIDRMINQYSSPKN